MDNYIIVDIKAASLEVEQGMNEAAVLVVENNKPVDKLHFHKVEDTKMLYFGDEKVYRECSEDEEFMDEFKRIIKKYEYPLVSHSASFTRKFLVNNNCIDVNYTFYDSIRVLKTSRIFIGSYKLDSLRRYMGLDHYNLNNAINSVEILFKIINDIKPTIWNPMSITNFDNAKKRKNDIKKLALSSLKEEIKVVKDIFSGKKITFVGKTDHSKNTLIKYAKEHGADVNLHINSDCDLVVYGSGDKMKLKEAEKLNIEILSVEDFLIKVGKKIV